MNTSLHNEQDLHARTAAMFLIYLYENNHLRPTQLGDAVNNWRAAELKCKEWFTDETTGDGITPTQLEAAKATLRTLVLNKLPCSPTVTELIFDSLYKHFNIPPF